LYSRLGLALVLALAVACGAQDIVIVGEAGKDVPEAADEPTGADGQPGEDGTLAEGQGGEAGQEPAGELPDSDTFVPELGPDGPEATPDTTPDTTGVCIQDNDGVLEASEMPVALGAAPSYVVNAAGTQADVAVDGAVGSDGVRVWDFTQGPTDQSAVLFVDPPEGWWFAEHFPQASFVSPLSAQDPSILAAYLADEAGVHLLGIASSQPDPPQGRTLLVYDAPVDVLRFPMQVGTSYTVTSSFHDATLAGIPNAGQETYTVTGDAIGTVKLPVFTVKNALRIRIDVKQKFVISTSPDPIPSIQYLYVHECVGELARVMSPLGETNPHFKKAKEFRRLGL
jgi:hypothetical protein